MCGKNSVPLYVLEVQSFVIHPAWNYVNDFFPEAPLNVKLYRLAVIKTESLDIACNFKMKTHF